MIAAILLFATINKTRVHLALRARVLGPVLESEYEQVVLVAHVHVEACRGRERPARGAYSRVNCVPEHVSA